MNDEIIKLKNEMVGNRYLHFKGNVYIVTDIATHTETEEIMVIYKDFRNLDSVWCRPLEMFLSPVDKEKYPDVKQQLRFERLTDE